MFVNYLICIEISFVHMYVIMCSVEQIFTFMMDGSSNRGGGGPMSLDSYTMSPGLRTEKDMRSILSTSAVDRA